MKIEAEIEKGKTLYNAIKEFLKMQFPDTFEESEQYDNCYHIAIYSQDNENFAVWFEYDFENAELIVGHGINHRHYGKQYGDEISTGFNYFFDLLLSKKRRTDFFKGSLNFKTNYEIEEKNGTYNSSGGNSIFLYPFWKKTTRNLIEQKALIENKKVKLELEKLRNLMITSL